MSPEVALASKIKLIIIQTKKASDFSEAFIVVAGSIQISNQFFEDYYGIIVCASYFEILR